MPNADRNLFFEHHGLPTHKRWQDGYAELSLKVYRAFDRVQQAVGAALRELAAHRWIVASAVGTRVFIDFRVAQKYTLMLNANVSEIVFLVPALTPYQACSFLLEIIQAGAGSFTITAWTGLVFFAPDHAYMSGGLPILSTVAGRRDVVAFSYDGFSEQLCGMYTQGAAA